MFPKANHCFIKRKTGRDRRTSSPLSLSLSFSLHCCISLPLLLTAVLTAIMGVANRPPEEICLSVSQLLFVKIFGCEIVEERVWWRLGLTQILLSTSVPLSSSLCSPTFQSFRHALKASEGKSHNLKYKNFHLNINTRGFHLYLFVCVCVCAAGIFWCPESIFFFTRLLLLCEPNIFSLWGPGSWDVVGRWSVYSGTMPVIFVCQDVKNEEWWWKDMTEHKT